MPSTRRRPAEAAPSNAASLDSPTAPEEASSRSAVARRRRRSWLHMTGQLGPVALALLLLLLLRAWGPTVVEARRMMPERSLWLRGTTTTRATLSFSILPPIFQRRAPTAAVGSEGSGSSTSTSTTGNGNAPTPSSPIETRRKEERLAELGFSFSPAGLLLPYHLGVASLLRDRRVITASTPLGGSSAGALVAILIGLDIPIKRALEACFEINESWGGALLAGTGGVLSIGERWANLTNGGGGNGAATATRRGTEDLKTLLHRVLDEVLPEDAHLRLNNRRSPVTVGVTQLALAPLPKFFMRPQAIQSFSSREDLIECLLASCCVPFWYTPGPFVFCRGAPAIDGYFSVPSHRFGCPYVPSQRTVLVSPFPASAVARGGSPLPEEAAAIEWLSPQLALDAMVEAGATAVKRAGMRQLLRDALSSNAREQVRAYYEQGRKDAELWLKTSGFYRESRGGNGGMRSGGGFPLL